MLAMAELDRGSSDNQLGQLDCRSVVGVQTRVSDLGEGARVIFNELHAFKRSVEPSKRSACVGVADAKSAKPGERRLEQSIRVDVLGELIKAELNRRDSAVAPFDLLVEPD